MSLASLFIFVAELPHGWVVFCFCSRRSSWLRDAEEDLVGKSLYPFSPGQTPTLKFHLDTPTVPL